MKIISKILSPIILICLFLISVGTVLASDFQVKELKTPNGIKLWFMEEKSLPIYGTGENIRDWLYVEDHCDAINTI